MPPALGDLWAKPAKTLKNWGEIILVFSMARCYNRQNPERRSVRRYGRGQRIYLPQ